MDRICLKNKPNLFVFMCVLYSTSPPTPPLPPPPPPVIPPPRHPYTNKDMRAKLDKGLLAVYRVLEGITEAGAWASVLTILSMEFKEKTTFERRR